MLIPLLLSFCATSVLGGIFHPEQIHLSYTGAPGELKVLWVTWLDFSSTLQFRPVTCSSEELSDSGWTTVEGTSRIFYPGDKKHWRYSIHEATMTGLQSICIYEYQLSNGPFWSESFEVNGRTPGSEPHEPARTWIYGDWGTGPNGKDTLQLLLDKANLENTDAIFHIGDIAYDLDSLQGWVGDTFLRMAQPIAARFPYLVGFGNHDRDSRNNTQYKSRFSPPVNEANQGTGYFYSLDIGPVHYIMLNTVPFHYGHDPLMLQIQHDWLVDDIKVAQARRDEVPWLVVMSHLDMYCTVDWRSPNPQKNYHECLADAKIFQDYAEDLFFENNVDIVIQAHVHNYERDTPIYHNISYSGEKDTFHKYYSPKAPVYIVSGNGGNSDGHNDPISTTFAPWTRFMSQDYGIGKLEVYNATHAYWVQYKAKDQSILDYIWIEKEAE